MEPSQKEEIQKKLLEWFKRNKRDLPWRKTKDPYAIWVSEMMLQQTQVETVIPYYKNFLSTFPTLQHLAEADLSEVLKVWEGLGYYSRARNLHRAAKMVLNRFRGKIPNSLNALLSLPGIGRYTAGAILSIAYNQEAPILDGNVKRVLARLFAISKNPEKKDMEHLLWKISESLIPKNRARFFNQALMDLGAMICAPKRPICLSCPLSTLCKGYLSGAPEHFPPRFNKRKIPQRRGMVAIIQRDGKVLLQQRPFEGFLGGLWEFPNWEINERGSERVRLRNEIKKEMGLNVEVKGLMGTFTQTYSHFKLTLHAFYCQPLGRKKKGRWVSINQLDRFPMSRIHRKIAYTLNR